MPSTLMTDAQTTPLRCPSGAESAAKTKTNSKLISVFFSAALLHRSLLRTLRLFRTCFDDPRRQSRVMFFYEAYSAPFIGEVSKVEASRLSPCIVIRT